MTIFHARTVDEWRDWLASHGSVEREVWLVIYNKDSGTPSPRYGEAIEHALCYGWIDSQARKHTSDSTVLRFTPRRPGSTWSALNRSRASRMTSLGLMTPAGRAMIDLARANGRWEVGMPSELRDLLDRTPPAAAQFAAFPPSSQRLILEWIARARTAETRDQRITETVTLAAQNRRANHPVPAPRG